MTPVVLAPAENLVLPSQDHPSGHDRVQGTSFAGPIVLGAAACVWQAHPEWSAVQVRSALVRTARRRPAWRGLGAGLIDVEAAVTWPAERAPAGVRTPYARYLDWRDRPERARVAAALEGGDEAVEALLSFLPDQVTDGVARASAGLLRRRRPRMRAAALCVLAQRPDHLEAEPLRPHLSDANAHVRAAALRAVRAAPQVRDPLLPDVGKRLADTSPDVCQAAAELVAEMRATGHVGALVDGLAEDVRRRWPATFVSRTNALERLTGEAFEPRREWRTGDPLFDDRWWLAREAVAARWLEFSRN